MFGTGRASARHELDAPLNRTVLTLLTANRLHLDLYPTGRDNGLPLERRIEMVEAGTSSASAERGGRRCTEP
jgi:hypothetical protein